MRQVRGFVFLVVGEFLAFWFFLCFGFCVFVARKNLPKKSQCHVFTWGAATNKGHVTAKWNTKQESINIRYVLFFTKLGFFKQKVLRKQNMWYVWAFKKIETETTIENELFKKSRVSDQHCLMVPPETGYF